ncbi:MAG TPA: hypothetical protein VNO24_07535 [Blastocatellia bacterium]|nr:hypothetical protein [Blastocatellia bacterium]
MRKNERDTVRQVLETALKNLSDALDGEASPESIALFGDPWPSSESRGSEVPIVLIVTGDLSSPSQNTAAPKPANVDEIKERAGVNSCVSDHSERKLSHPGLERFIMLAADSAPRAPKACFMEPDRDCVNSGACEMRGF